MVPAENIRRHHTSVSEEVSYRDARRWSLPVAPAASPSVPAHPQIQ